MNIAKSFLMVCVVMMLAAENSLAAPIGLTLEPAPDIFSAFISVNYDAGTKVFTASGTAFQINDDNVGVNENIVDGTFDVTASISNAGDLLGGTLSIGGTVPTLGYNSGTLLTGNLTELGFPDVGIGPLELLFAPTGGDAVGLYGSTGGILLSDTSFSSMSFTNNFSTTLSTVADVGVQVQVVPEPSSLAVWLFAFGCAWGIRRRLKLGSYT